MSAAGGAGAAAGGAGAVTEAPPALELHRIPLTPFRENHAQYITLLKRALHSGNDDELDAMRPTTDEEYYRFFILAVAKELKYIANSAMFPFFLNESLNYGVVTSYNPKVLKGYYGVSAKDLSTSLLKKLKELRGELRRMLGALPSTDERYIDVLNSIFRKRKPWGAETPEKELDYYDSYLESAVTVLQESLRVIKNGHPLKEQHTDVPTTLFLYCRRTPEGQPLYVGHIFTQVVTGVPPEFVEFLGADGGCPDPADLPYMFFVSIYKSLLDQEKALSSRIFADVEAYAREQRCALMMTLPLPNMDKILKGHGFKRLETRREERGKGRRRHAHHNEEGAGGDPVFLRGLGPGGKIACGTGSTGRSGRSGSTGSSKSSKSSKSRSASAGAGASTRRSSRERSTGGRRMRRTKRQRR